MHQQNELISKSEGLITRNNALIERKQTQIDQINKKIDHKLSSMDGVSLFTVLQELISVASCVCCLLGRRSWTSGAENRGSTEANIS